MSNTVQLTVSEILEDDTINAIGDITVPKGVIPKDCPLVTILLPTPMQISYEPVESPNTAELMDPKIGLKAVRVFYPDGPAGTIWTPQTKADKKRILEYLEFKEQGLVS